jgi:protein-S-isoprenylcysteine O-methyltransferase Ste14
MTPESTFRILFWILFGAVLVMRFYFIFRVGTANEQVLPDQKAIEHEGKGLFAFRLASWFAMIAVLASYALNLSWLDRFHIIFPDGLRWAGFALVVISILFWTWTQVALGKDWSPQLQLRYDHHLVTTGPYAHIRHPMYTAITGFGVGLALVGANWIFVALVVLVVVGMALRIPKEEKMLINEFGDEYRSYMQRTGSLLPR